MELTMSERHQLLILVVVIWVLSLSFYFSWYEGLSPEDKELVKEYSKHIDFNMTLTEVREKSPRVFNFMIIGFVVSGIGVYLRTRGHPV